MTILEGEFDYLRAHKAETLLGEQNVCDVLCKDVFSMYLCCMLSVNDRKISFLIEYFILSVEVV